MASFQVRSLPGYDWPALADAGGAQVWDAFLELERTQWLDPGTLHECQLEQIRELLAHCIMEVPYYRDELPRAGITPGSIQTMADFRRIPLLPRRTYQERYAEFEASRLPDGTVATGVRKTSGSSGTPTSVLMTNVVNLWWCAFFLRDLQWCGVDTTGVLAAIRSTGQKGENLAKGLQGIRTPAWVADLAPVIVTGPAHLMDIQQDHRIQLQWLRRIAPHYLLSYPANLEVLADLMAGQGKLPTLKAVLSISDTLTPERRQKIEAAFGVPVKNTYSCAEMGYLASPCPSGHGLHIHAENVLLEVLDAAGRPCAPGETGRVHVTSLHNFRGPLIRYELGDEATFSAGPCPCGRGLPLLHQVVGKNSPMFLLLDGRRKSSTILARLVRRIGGHWQHQVVQDARDHVVVRLAVNAAWTGKGAEELIRIVRDFFEGPVRVDVEIADRLPTPAHGKFQNMICTVESGAHTPSA